MGKNILVVDDSPSMLSMLSDMLKSFDYEVTTAENGYEGCRLLETDNFDLIFTDLNMPGMNGIEFIQKARQIKRSKFVPIVILSGENDKEKIMEARKMGISTFLEKPFKLSKLKALIQVVLG